MGPSKGIGLILDYRGKARVFINVHHFAERDGAEFVLVQENGKDDRIGREATVPEAAIPKESYP
jgi:hypothetical protein